MPKSFPVDEVTGQPIVDHLPYDLILAAAAHDSWAFGVVLFQLCSAEPFLLANTDDNTDPIQLQWIYHFTNSFKRQKLARIPDKLARNLIAQLLSKDPTRRLTMERALVHPFISGKIVTRMPGESANFDIFLSYRVDSDSVHVEYFFDRFVSQGYRVWW